jgi:hypothetical protein
MDLSVSERAAFWGVVTVVMLTALLMAGVMLTLRSGRAFVGQRKAKNLLPQASGF